MRLLFWPGRVVEDIQESLRDLRQREAHGGFARSRERDPQIAVTGKLRIERNRPEAGNFQFRGFRSRQKAV